MTIQRDFTFENGQVGLKIPIDRAVYAGSVSAEKSATFVGNADPVNWVGDYYRAFIDEQHQAAFYASMEQALHDARQQQGLDSSSYVELVTSMAQEIRYRVDAANLAPKFPIETFGDGYGDCDDKTLLAAAILSRDGYDVAILLFTPEKHVALGLRAPGLDYKGTGYAYVEMTEPSLVGVSPQQLAGGVTLTSQPDVIRIGKGTRTYAAGDQIVFIQQRLEQAQVAEKQLSAQITADNTNLNSQEASLQTARAAAQSSADPASAQSAIERYNAQVRVYDDLVARVNVLVKRHNAIVDAERFVADHQTARTEVYARLRDLAL